MNKALEALEQIKTHFNKYVGDADQREWCYAIENALLEADPLYIIKNTYFDLCAEVAHCCMQCPDTPWRQIPEAVAALKAVKEYEAFVLKYYNIDLNPKHENK